LSEIIDFTADMTWIGSENISNFDVYINGDYYGSNVNKIQITTNDTLTISVTKNDNTQEGLIKFDCNLV
jgi:archaellum component FlaF (FlaF/FlaG flagellin family)